MTWDTTVRKRILAPTRSASYPPQQDPSQNSFLIHVENIKKTENLARNQNPYEFEFVSKALYHIISIIKTRLKSHENDIDGDTNGKRKKSMECTKNKGIVDRGKMKSWDENSMQMQCNSMVNCRETKGFVGFSFGDSENVFTSGWVRRRCYKVQNAGRTFL